MPCSGVKFFGFGKLQNLLDTVSLIQNQESVGAGIFRCSLTIGQDVLMKHTWQFKSVTRWIRVGWFGSPASRHPLAGAWDILYWHVQKRCTHCRPDLWPVFQPLLPVAVWLVFVSVWGRQKAQCKLTTHVAALLYLPLTPVLSRLCECTVCVRDLTEWTNQEAAVKKTRDELLFIFLKSHLYAAVRLRQ